MESSKRLPQAGPGTQSIGAGKPLADSYPNSEKISAGELAVPARRIHLSGGEPPLTVYDTSGPEGVDPRVGLPKRRAPWLARRAGYGADIVTQLHYARRGIVTEEMR